MKKLLIVFVLTAIFSTSFAQQDSTIIILSLEKAQELAKSRNLELKNSELEIIKGNFQAKEARSKLYPQLDAYSNFTYNYSVSKIMLPGEIIGQSGMIPVEMGTKFDWNSGFKATQVIFNLSYFTTLKISEKLTEVSHLSYEMKQKELLNQLSKVYFLAVSTRMHIDKLEKSSEDADKLIGITTQLNQQGLVREIDITKIKITKNNILTQIDNLQMMYNQQKELLKLLIGIKSESNIQLSDTIITINYLHQKKTDFIHKEDVKLLDKQSEIALLTKKSLKQSYLPTLTGFWQHYYQSQRNKFDFFEDTKNNFFKAGFVGITLNIPLFDGFDRQSKIKQKEIEYQQILNNKELILANYSKKYNDALSQYETGLKALNRAKENIEIAQKTYNTDLISYRQGILSQSDMLLSENSLIEAELNYINQLFQVKNAELELEYIIE